MGWGRVHMYILPVWKILIYTERLNVPIWEKIAVISVNQQCPATDFHHKIYRLQISSITRVRVNKLWATSQSVASVSHCEPINQQVIKLTVCEAASKSNQIQISVLKKMSFFFWTSYSKTLRNFILVPDILVVIVALLKISLKCACVQEEIVQLGDVSRGFHSHDYTVTDRKLLF